MSTLMRCEEFAPRMSEHQFFSHTTALELFAVPLLDSGAGDLHVSARPPAREPRVAGVIGHRVRLLEPAPRLHSGLPVAPPAEAWAQSATLLPRDELIVAGDALLHSGEVTLEELQAAAARQRVRGAVDLRAALEDIRPGAESRQETRARLVLVRAGLPEPELNWTLRSASGSFVARLDLAYPQYRVCVEYDGRHHAAPEQFAKDADRWAAIEQEGWLLVRVLSHHLRHPQEAVVARTRRALRQRGWDG